MNMIKRLVKPKTLSCMLSMNFSGRYFNFNARTMAKILNGTEIAAQLKNELKNEIDSWVASDHKRPQLTCVLVGNDPASATYVRKKMEAAQLVGIISNTININASISQKDLLDKLNELNNDDSIDGILVQLPLPESIDERTVCNAVVPEKDVDGFHIMNVGKLCLDMDTLIPCTPAGVIEIIKRNNIETFGCNAVVVSRSKNIGLPVAMLLHADGRHESGLGMDATVTICHRYTPAEQLAMHCRNADIIITATGIPGLIKADMVKPGATVIDVGLTKITDPDTGANRFVGDVDFKEVSEVAGAITPVPGGVGPMTVAMLMKNTFIAAKNRDKIYKK